MTVTTDDKRLQKRLIALAWLAVAGLLAARALRRGVPTDFEIFWHAAQAAADGQPLYHGEAFWHGWYLYSPAFSVLFRPLVWLPIEWAYASWIAASLAAIFASSWLLERAIARGPGLRAFRGLGLLALLILAVPTASNFRWGNSNAFMMLLVTIAFASLVARRTFWTGLALSLASAIKLTPLVFLAWIVLRREWHALAGFGVGTLLWLALLPALGLGPRYALHETVEWVQTIVLPAVEVSAPLEDAASSLPRVAERLLSPGGVGAKPTGGEASASVGLSVGLSVGILLAVLLLAVTAACAAREPGVGAISFGLIGVAMFLAAPAARGAHLMQIYPLVGLLLACAAGGALPFARRARSGLVGAVCCMLVLFACARLFGVSSKEFFPMTALALALWSTGVVLVLGARGSGMDERGAC